MSDARADPRPDPSTLLLDGRSGTDGFVFHDGHNQRIHRAAPGLLGLLEARCVISRWRPQILRWLDDTDHFFDHLFAEFEGEPAFEARRREIQEIRALDAPLPFRNRVLFQYLRTATRELERSALTATVGNGHGRPLAIPEAEVPSSVSLAGSWKVRYRRCPGTFVDEAMDLPVNWELVPGVENYSGTMRFSRVFTLDDDAPDHRVTVLFHGADYFVDLWVNGYHAGGHEGCFGPFEIDVTPFVRRGDDNILRLTVASPNDPSGPGTSVTSGWDDFSPASAFPNRKTMVKGTLGHHDARRGGAWSSLTGQDGNTGGVWNDLELRLVGRLHLTVPGTRVTTLSASTRPGGDAWAKVHVAVRLRNALDHPVAGRLRVTVEAANFEGRSFELERSVTVPPGAGDAIIEEELSGVRLWHPRDHGFPHLYRVTTTVLVGDHVQDRSAVETGFRVLAVSPIGESEGHEGAFVVNGSPVFVRGTNLLPTYWLSEYTSALISRDFDMLTEAGFNAVIVHTLVLPRRFYEEANRRGFLVEQIFPLQWSYEQSAELAAHATTQIQEMAALLMNEPSVVSYEVHNEPDMRTAEDLDNRLVDFDLHASLRVADPSRWATTFSSGNHAYPGQFYPLRDDNGFATLPARFLEHEVHGRRISRHRNMPTEFGIQAMPSVELFGELVSEGRVKHVLERIRNDPRWLATGAESWEETEKGFEEVRRVLGDDSWERALAGLDWSLLFEPGALDGRIREIEQGGPDPDPAAVRELLSCRLAQILLEVLHYGGFKGENFWFGLWRPADTLEGFVMSSQQRQYRLHKDAIENYLNAGATGPIVGFFSFMFRDADWQAPTWGVVDAAFVPKKAYRSYLESNGPVRVSLPQALRSPVKLPGDPWIGAPDEGEGSRDPWVAADVIVANDTSGSLPGARVAVWLEDAAGVRRYGREPVELTVDLAGGHGWSGRWPGQWARDWTVPDDVAAGTYFLTAQLSSAEGRALSTNRYELLVLDTEFDDLHRLSDAEVRSLLQGAKGSEGFHFWQGGAVVHAARPGVDGLAAGFRQAQARGVDLYEAIQGEHLFRHLFWELGGCAYAEAMLDDVWRIRSEVLSPREKSRVLLRYLELLGGRGRERLAGGAAVRTGSGETAGGGGRRVAPGPGRAPERATAPPAPPAPPVGKDIARRLDSRQQEEER